ncbi:MAG: hypothetical protein AB7F99_14895 [Vicinamibacterales bacterium]
MRILVTLTLTAWMTAGLAAQAPSAVGTESVRAALAEPSVHLEGCLYEDVSGSQPSTQQASGYIVEDLKVISQRDSGAEVPVRYAVRGAADTGDRLKAFAGKRVGITGRVGTDANPPELQVTAIREIVGQCARRAAS